MKAVERSATGRCERDETVDQRHRPGTMIGAVTCLLLARYKLAIDDRQSFDGGESGE
jgi:hypothetical protein